MTYTATFLFLRFVDLSQTLSPIFIFCRFSGSLHSCFSISVIHETDQQRGFFTHRPSKEMSYPDNQGQSLIPAPVHITPLDSFYISFIISFFLSVLISILINVPSTKQTVQKFNIIHHRSRALMTSETFMTINKHRRGFITVHTCHYNEFHDGLAFVRAWLIMKMFTETHYLFIKDCWQF